MSPVQIPPTPPNGLDQQQQTSKTHAQATTPSFATRAIHIGSEPELSASNGVTPSLDLSTTYLQTKVGVHKGFEYTRSSNPTRLALERVVSSLEGHADVLLQQAFKTQGIDADKWENGPAALAFASGSAATATVVSGLAGRGGHLVSVGDVYGGTSRYMLRVASEQQGVETTFVDMSYSTGGPIITNESSSKRVAQDDAEDQEIVARLEAAIRPDTKLIWAETPTNPILSLVPIALIARVAKAHDIPLVIDNTFSNPYYQSPLTLGASVVVHSGTKYLGGHSDVLSGFIITPVPSLLEKFRFLQNANGNVPSPFDSWLVIRSLKTLTLRSRQHGLNALQIATWLQEVAVTNGWVRDVRYPGLKRQQETSGQRRERELAWSQLSDEAKKWVEKQGFSRDGDKGFPSGGMVSFHIQSQHEASQDKSEAAEAFLEALQVFALAESLGGVESLAELPLRMTHAGVAPERRRQLGIDGELIRLSVGVEEADDLLADVEQALQVAVGSQA
ncbi:cystathionine gamma-lyase cys3 [Microbotryomycetes sp. JL221]|nr:cystathionine gamma-lyase cys3 [Microbotryomycetes sp. JL221]